MIITGKGHKIETKKTIYIPNSWFNKI